MGFLFRMSHTLTPYYKRIIRRQLATGRFNNESEVIRHSLRLMDSLERAAGPLGCSFAGREDLEELLLEGLVSGAGKPMTPARKKQIYKQALEEA
jgi:putative addiction module CopG family antidote